MSTIGAISTPPAPPTAQATLVQPKRDNDHDEATESNAAKASEAASPHKVDIKARGFLR
jgi:hypothetical protein